MEIVINNNRKIFAIQEEFNNMFPGLAIAFYAKPNKSGGAPSTKLVQHSSKTLHDCRSINKEGTIEILPTMNISELKKYFRDIFELSIEIFQKGEERAEENPISEKQTFEELNKEFSGKKAFRFSLNED